MSKFLDDFLVTMPTTQRKKLLELLDMKKQEGLIRTSSELQAELERMIAEMDSRDKGPTFQARPQEHQVDSVSYNKNMDEIAFDLLALFDASASVDRLIMDNKQLSRSLLSSIKKDIYGIQSQLQRHKMLMLNSDGFVDGIHEQFNASRYTETSEKVLQTLRAGRFDNVLDQTYLAENVGDSLQLSGTESVDQIKSSYGRKLARIEVLNRTGNASQNPNHEIDKAIDGSLNTYWAESILVDQPIVQNIDDLWRNDYTDFPKDGAISEVEITLNGMTTVSDIQFDPFCSYPLEIVSIFGYETEDLGGHVHELISPNHKNIHQRSKKSVNRMSFQFPSVDVMKLRLLVRQENYVKENYMVNTDEMKNMELWRKLSSSPELIDDYKHKNETVAEFDRKNEVTGWNVYLEKLTEWAKATKQKGVLAAAKVAMKTVRMGDYKNPMLLKLVSLSPDKQEEFEEPVLNQSYQAVNKLSYLYGAYDISVFGRKYKHESIYISTPLPLSTNATRISLETTERHHDAEIGIDVVDRMTGKTEPHDLARITDIEFYLTYKKNPTSADWKPILPAHKAYVKGELLLGDLITEVPDSFAAAEKAGNPVISYSFRFPIVSDATLVLRRNGVPMSPSTYLISDDGRKIGIYTKYYMASSVYTVDYKPHDEAWFVTLDESTDIHPTQYIDDNGETGESFTSADMNSSIKLKHKPYLFRKNLFTYNEDENSYDQEQSSLSSKAPEFPMIVRVGGEEYLNITNYDSNTYDVERLIENEGKCFAQYEDMILFGKPTDGTPLKNITVDYYYVATDIRMKAILRRNSVEDESVTPALYDYHIRCQSYDQEV